MATRPEPDSPWPQPTLHPASTKGKHKLDMSVNQLASRPSHRVRQNAFPGASVNSNNCGIVSNDVISCFPVVDAVVVQNIDTRFVWNTGLPQFSQTNLVDVYLIHGDSDELVALWPTLPYHAGHLAVTPNDTWWGAKGPTFTPGKNLTQTYFFVLVANGTNSLSQPPQSTFTATQTDFPNSILSSQSVASVASAASAASAAAEASAASVASSKSALSDSTATSSKGAPSSSGGALQNSSGSSNNFPHWGIALLAVFGFFAFLCFLFAFWALIRTIRKRRKPHLSARRNSIGSESPMIPDAHSPVGAAPGSSSAHGEPQSIESGLGPLPMISARHNVVSSDGASTVSRADSAGGPFSAIDAAAMAAAFRNVMRKPDFADRPMEEGEVVGEKETDVLNRELAEEGRDIRSVSSSRGVKVETLSEAGDTPI